ITLSVNIREDRRLVIDLPADVPLGTAELIIKPHGTNGPQPAAAAREAARAKLLAAGILNASHQAPEGAVALSNEELSRLGRLTPGTRSSEEIINEERGEY